ncbi:DUF3888 domain-containing protein [Bacillus sp. BRMEA1]|uniref:DUF3888 domain-containing protein n=1 Tax=Neobacillus endophyticus TaxID=2738405 RepID=UPI0015678663|nr:DUF3888 domain-containing protein [Neobacillus endophyticus]NRD76629.1 DUF3888 domain-containing protein [Neobacillus endophyticus]
MRKIVVLAFTTFLVFATSNLANAEVTESGRIKKEVYATSEDVLMEMLKPELNKIISDKYGHEKIWQISKVAKVALIADHTKKPSENWYEMNIFVRVYDDKNDKELLDDIDIRIDIPNMFTKDRYKVKNPDMKVTLIKYEQWQGQEMIK